MLEASMGSANVSYANGARKAFGVRFGYLRILMPPLFLPLHKFSKISLKDYALRKIGQLKTLKKMVNPNFE